MDIIMNTHQRRSLDYDNIIKLNRWTQYGHHFYSEQIFQETLYRERKRAERSGRPFLLMLIDVEKIIQKTNGQGICKKILSQLDLQTRETDIKGWFSERAVIGIIFTEMGEHDRDFIIDRITQRVRNSLFFVIESQYFHTMRLELQWFPNENDETENAHEPNPLFYPDLLEKAVHKVFAQYIKRMTDIAGSITALILFSPLFLIIPILIKLTSRGPVLFRQERLGLSGKTFTFLKFRSMYVDSDDSIHRHYIRQLIQQENEPSGDNETPTEGEVYKITDDPRVTLIGKFLRKTSLDELPQFINVLRGDMSLVGPRPPIPYECDDYKLWHRRRVIEVKPGITGLWQVEGRSSTSFDEMVRLDLKYIRDWSLWLDVKLLIKTPWVVITGKGAY